MSAQLDIDSLTIELEAYEMYQEVLAINTLGQKSELKNRSLFTHKIDSFIFNHLGNGLSKFEYLSDSKKDTLISYGWENDGWEASSYRVIRYNGFGQLLESTSHILDGIDGDNPVLDKPIVVYSENNYDQENRLIRSETGYFNSPESEISILTYLYDDKGRLSDLVSTRFLPQLDTTLKLQHDYYTYDDELDTLTCIDVYKLFNWSSSNANWRFGNKTQFIYNDNSQLDSLTSFGMLDSVLTKVFLCTFQYNLEGKIEREIDHFRFEDNEWQSIRKTEYVYSEYGSLLELNNYRVKFEDLIIHEEDKLDLYVEIYEHNPNTTFEQISNFRVFDDIKRIGISPDLLLEPFNDKMILKRRTTDYGLSVIREEVSHFYYSEINTVNTNETSVDVVSISPNPATSAVFINSNSLVIDEIRIYDINGQFVSKSSYSRELDVSGLQPGVYFLEFISGGRRFVERLFKVK